MGGLGRHSGLSNSENEADHDGQGRQQECKVKGISWVFMLNHVTTQMSFIQAGKHAGGVKIFTSKVMLPWTSLIRRGSSTKQDGHEGWI